MLVRVVHSFYMERPAHRLNVTLDPEHAARLARLAERTHVQEGTLARSLLSVAIEEADPEHVISSRCSMESRALTNTQCRA